MRDRLPMKKRLRAKRGKYKYRPVYRIIVDQNRCTEREFVCRLAAMKGTSYGAAKSIINLFWGKLSDLLMCGKTFDLELSKKHGKEV